MESKKRFVAAFHNIAGSAQACHRYRSERIPVEAYKVYRRHYFEEVVTLVVPTHCSEWKELEFASIAAPGIDRYQTASVVMFLAMGLVLVEGNSLAEPQDYMCHNSYKLLHWGAVACHNAGNAVPVDLRTVDTLWTYIISPLKVTTQQVEYCTSLPKCLPYSIFWGVVLDLAITHALEEPGGFHQ